MFDAKARETLEKIKKNLHDVVEAHKAGKDDVADKLDKERIETRKHFQADPVIDNESVRETLQKSAIIGVPPLRMKALKRDPQTMRPVVNEDLLAYHDWHDDLMIGLDVLQLKLDKKHGKNRAPRATVEMLREDSVFGKWRRFIDNGKREFAPFLKTDREYVQKASTYYTTGSTAGDEFIPVGLSQDYIDVQHLPFRLLSRIPRKQMDMKEQGIPAYTADHHFSKGSEATDADSLTRLASSNAATSKVSLDAKDFVIRVVITRDFMMDAIFDQVVGTRKKLQTTAAMDLEDVVLNGDTNTTHFDTSVTSSTDRRKIWKGLRRYEYDDGVTARTAMNHTNFTYANLVGLRDHLTSGYRSIDNLTYVSAPKTTRYIGNLSQFQGMLQYGSDAHQLTGQIAVIAGVPYLESELVAENLNASGVYDGTTTDRGIIMLFNHEAFVLGQYEDLTVEVVDRPEYNVIHIIGNMRADFVPKVTTTSKIVISLGYNLYATS